MPGRRRRSNALVPGGGGAGPEPPGAAAPRTRARSPPGTVVTRPRERPHSRHGSVSEHRPGRRRALERGGSPSEPRADETAVCSARGSEAAVALRRSTRVRLPGEHAPHFRAYLREALEARSGAVLSQPRRPRLFPASPASGRRAQRRGAGPGSAPAPSRTRRGRHARPRARSPHAHNGLRAVHPRASRPLRVAHSGPAAERGARDVKPRIPPRGGAGAPGKCSPGPSSPSPAFPGRLGAPRASPFARRPGSSGAGSRCADGG